MAGKKNHKKKQSGGKVMPVLFTIAGILMLLIVAAAVVVMSVPQTQGYVLYTVDNGSMYPDIPAHSLAICDTPVEESYAADDIVLWQNDTEVYANRVVYNNDIEAMLTITANQVDEESPTQAAYDNILGRAVYIIPLLGYAWVYYSTSLGQVYAVLAALCGIMFIIVAGRMRAYRKARMVQRELDEIEDRISKLRS